MHPAVLAFFQFMSQEARRPEPPPQAEPFPWLLALVFAMLLAGLILLAHKQRRLRYRHRQLNAAFKHAQSDLLRTRRRVYATEAAAALDRAGRSSPLPVEFTAQYGEDLFLWDLFEGKTDGRYIEVGAYDGYTLSVTYPFEAVGWRGVLIEALPERYQACKQRRPGSDVFHAALSKRGSSGTTTFTMVVGESESEMLSYLSTNQPHRRLITKRKDQSRTVTVPLTTMDDVLGRSSLARVGAGAEHSPGIDFAVIDVEGGEPDLLDGFDLERYVPRVLIVEDLFKGRDSRVAGMLANRHYVWVARIGINNVFIRAEERALIERARTLTSVLE